VTAGRLTYVGHATVLVEQGGVRLLTDPLVRTGVAHVRRRVPVPDLEQLRDLDAILISHAHADHLDIASLKRLEHRGPVVAPRGCAGMLVRAGLPEVIEMDAGERCTVSGTEIEAVPADHDGKRHPLAKHIAALGFILHGRVRVYFAGDTDLFDGMAELAGRVDVALLPIWGWGPRLPAGHLNPESAARATALIRPGVAVPIHWGTLRSVGTRVDGDTSTPARTFAANVAALASSTHVRILEPGASMPLTG
jgi:L-ascorbate metabolism protein UlaG (beta-lactamase superfamily)